MINKLIKNFSISTAPVVKNQSTVYFFNKQNNMLFGSGWKNEAIVILTAFFKNLNSLISQPVFTLYPNKVKIHIFYYIADLGKLFPKESKKQYNYYLHRISKSENDLKDPKDINLSLEQLKVLNQIAKIIKTRISKLSESRIAKLPRAAATLTKGSRSSRISSRNIIKKNNKIWSFLIKLHLAYLVTNRLRDLGILLSKYLKTNIELEVVRLIHPYHDSNILAQLIAINGRASIYRRIQNTVLNKSTILIKEKAKLEHSSKHSKLNSRLNNIGIAAGINVKPINAEVNNNFNEKITVAVTEKKEIVSRLTGIKLRVAGRLARQRVVPKRTVQGAYKGRVSTTKLNLVDSSTYTGKNKKGAYTVKVWLSHGI